LREWLTYEFLNLELLFGTLTPAFSESWIYFTSPFVPWGLSDARKFSCIYQPRNFLIFMILLFWHFYLLLNEVNIMVPDWIIRLNFPSSFRKKIIFIHKKITYTFFIGKLIFIDFTGGWIIHLLSVQSIIKFASQWFFYFWKTQEMHYYRTWERSVASS